jgi:hypothetical protein
MSGRLEGLVEQRSQLLAARRGAEDELRRLHDERDADQAVRQKLCLCLSPVGCCCFRNCFCCVVGGLRRGGLVLERARPLMHVQPGTTLTHHPRTPTRARTACLKPSLQEAARVEAEAAELHAANAALHKAHTALQAELRSLKAAANAGADAAAAAKLDLGSARQENDRLRDQIVQVSRVP